MGATVRAANGHTRLVCCRAAHFVARGTYHLDDLFAHCGGSAFLRARGRGETVRARDAAFPRHSDCVPAGAGRDCSAALPGCEYSHPAVRLARDLCAAVTDTQRGPSLTSGTDSGEIWHYSEPV